MKEVKIQLFESLARHVANMKTEIEREEFMKKMITIGGKTKKFMDEFRIEVDRQKELKRCMNG